jgi:hypothetical protein
MEPHFKPYNANKPCSEIVRKGENAINFLEPKVAKSVAKCQFFGLHHLFIKS